MRNSIALMHRNSSDYALPISTIVSSVVSRLLLCALFSFLSVMSHVSLADDSIFNVTGFGTIGISKGGTDDLGFRQNYSQNGSYGDWEFKTDSSIGVQVNADFNEKLDAVVQFVAKDQVHNSVMRSLEWAFMRYKPTNSVDIRVGRMALDLFNISEYRNVGFAYLWARPPVEFYSLVPLWNINGVDIVFNNRIGDGVLQTKFFAGKAENYVYFEVAEYEIKFRPLYGLNLGYQHGAWKTRLTITKTKFDHLKNGPLTNVLFDAINAVPSNLWPNAVQAKDMLDLEGSNVLYSSVGIIYDQADWLIQTELSHISSEAAEAPSNNAGYFSIGKRLLSNVMLYSSYARVLTSSAPATVKPPIASSNLEGLYDVVINTLNINRINQYSYSIGVKWDISPVLTMKAQWDHVKVGKNSPGLFTTFSNPTKVKEMDNFSLNFSFIF